MGMILINFEIICVVKYTGIQFTIQFSFSISLE